MDDFGSGASSLTELLRAGLRNLKVERSLVFDLKHKHSRALVEAAVALGRVLGVDVVAKGVEHEWQHSLLRDLGCGFGQGRYYGASLNGDELCTQLAARHTLARLA
jgi:EAL domain-containing protein (putative c-di-GMP-specific phosphodiesterase class I)